jgi:hypothetical protein
MTSISNNPEKYHNKSHVEPLDTDIKKGGVVILEDKQGAHPIMLRGHHPERGGKSPGY